MWIIFNFNILRVKYQCSGSKIVLHGQFQLISCFEIRVTVSRPIIESESKDYISSWENIIFAILSTLIDWKIVCKHFWRLFHYSPSQMTEIEQKNIREHDTKVSNFFFNLSNLLFSALFYVLRVPWWLFQRVLITWLFYQYQLKKWDTQITWYFGNVTMGSTHAMRKS